MVFSFFKNLFSTSGNDGNEAKEQEQSAPQEQVEADLGAESTETPVQLNDGSEGRRASRHGRSHRRRGNGGKGAFQRQRDTAEDGNVPEISTEEEAKVLDKLCGFVLYVAKSLVENPDEVTAEVISKDRTKVIMISCAKKDTGKIIGRSGKIIAAIRILVSGSASRMGIKATVDIVD